MSFRGGGRGRGGGGRGGGYRGGGGGGFRGICSVFKILFKTTLGRIMIIIGNQLHFNPYVEVVIYHK